jgi:hypothetical protein
MRHIILLLFLALSLNIVAQSEKSSKRIGTNYKNFISGQLAIADPWAGAVYEHVFFDSWGFDIGAGILGGSVGTKFYILKLEERRFSYYLGVSHGIVLAAGARQYFPLGFTYLSDTGFRLSLDVGPLMEHNHPENTTFGFSLRLGAGLKKK